MYTLGSFSFEQSCLINRDLVCWSKNTLNSLSVIRLITTIINCHFIFIKVGGCGY